MSIFDESQFLWLAWFAYEVYKQNHDLLMHPLFWSGCIGGAIGATWIYRVALNTCISIDRKKKRRSAEVRLTMDINLFKDSDEDTRQVDMLHKRISRLQPFDRAIVLLWLENLSYEEIGQIVGITTKNVSVRLFRIREQLKQMSND